MSNLKEYYEHTRTCNCGSGLLPNTYKNHKQEDEKACNKCKHKLLYNIFDNHFLDIFEKWLPEIMFNEVAPIGYEFQWQDLLEEKKFQRTKEVKNQPNYTVIQCPEDKEYYIYIPNDTAEQILSNGKL